MSEQTHKTTQFDQISGTEPQLQDDLQEQAIIQNPVDVQSDPGKAKSGQIITEKRKQDIAEKELEQHLSITKSKGAPISDHKLTTPGVGYEAITKKVNELNSVVVNDLTNQIIKSDQKLEKLVEDKENDQVMQEYNTQSQLRSRLSTAKKCLENNILSNEAPPINFGEIYEQATGRSGSRSRRELKESVSRIKDKTNKMLKKEETDSKASPPKPNNNDLIKTPSTKRPPKQDDNIKNNSNKQTTSTQDRTDEKHKDKMEESYDPLPVFRIDTVESEMPDLFEVEKKSKNNYLPMCKEIQGKLILADKIEEV